MVHHCSDPHKFLVTGRIYPVSKQERTDPLGIYRLLKLQHSIPLVRVFLSHWGSQLQLSSLQDMEVLGNLATYIFILYWECVLKVCC